MTTRELAGLTPAQRDALAGLRLQMALDWAALLERTSPPTPHSPYVYVHLAPGLGIGPDGRTV